MSYCHIIYDCSMHSHRGWMGTRKKAVQGISPGTDAYKWAIIDAISEIRLKLLTGQISLNKLQPFN